MWIMWCDRRRWQNNLSTFYTMMRKFLHGNLSNRFKFCLYVFASLPHKAFRLIRMHWVTLNVLCMSYARIFSIIYTTLRTNVSNIQKLFFFSHFFFFFIKYVNLLLLHDINRIVMEILRKLNVYVYNGHLDINPTQTHHTHTCKQLGNIS